MKKFSILILAVAMIFSFASCDNSSVEYADSQAAADLVDAIDKNAMAADLVNAVDGKVTGLTITPTPETALTPNTEVTIKVTGTFSNTDGGYTSGFHTGQGVTWAITSGSGTVYVTGMFKNENGTMSITDMTYTASTDPDNPIKVSKTVDGKKTEYTFELQKLEGVAEGTITYENGKFSVSNIALIVPKADAVEAYLDGKPVNYNQLCSDTHFTPGDKIEYTPAVSEV